MEKRVVFKNHLLPYLLVAPQIIITLVFFIWPAIQALVQSFLLQDAFGTSSTFVWFENFTGLFASKEYLDSFRTTLLFSFSVAGVGLSVSLFLAVMADRALRSATFYKTLIIWPYAVAPVVAALLWYFLFNPTVGMVAFLLKNVGVTWNPTLNGRQAMTLVIIAAAWREISYNFLFFLAGLQAIPHSFIEAAAMDGAGPWRRFWTIVFPLLSPTLFFLIVVNIVYAFFDTFGVIHAITRGGPNYATNILVYKVFNDGFINLDLGGSAAQSVILMVVVVTLTVVQFRFIERRVHY
ncbi:MAG: sn-glycerol-3-phosphate ABC transporter permease UgpA [Thermodesulfobacteriota bacterium]